jgi:hypothetical protein
MVLTTMTRVQKSLVPLEYSIENLKRLHWRFRTR